MVEAEERREAAPVSRIFLSHSSRDNAWAIQLRDWLAGNGWDDVFLDLDPAAGLAPGERWQNALKAAADRCEAVLFLISPNWLASNWCLSEFLLAKQLGKRLFPLLIGARRSAPCRAKLRPIIRRSISLAIRRAGDG
jgi:hypothetical protein